MTRTPDKWAILIGVNRYHESLGPLKYAVNDCRRVGAVLTQGEDGFPADHVLLISDDQPEDRRPTYANIHSWLASWLSQPKENDTVFVYFSGHGRDMAGKCYLAPGDATLQTMHVTGIPVMHVQEILSRCKAKQKILVLDACHSGAGKDVGAMSGSMMDQIAAGKGIYTITSCDADELSHEWDEKKQGVFSYYLAEALSRERTPNEEVCHRDRRKHQEHAFVCFADHFLPYCGAPCGGTNMSPFFRILLSFVIVAVILALLLTFAGMPVWRASLLAVNLATFAAFGYDKRQAAYGGWRVPEAVLLVLAAAGGSPGALAGMALFRHKTRAGRFQAVLVAIVALQLVLLLSRGCGGASSP